MNFATNAGISHALVSYFGPAGGFRFTDVGGNFQFDGVPCQGYSLSISKPGFVSAEALSQQGIQTAFRNPLVEDEQENPAGRAPTPAMRNVDLAQESAPVRLYLYPVSSVNGTILDENGDPLAGVSVQAIAIRSSLSGTDYNPVQTALSDDRGHYALPSLTPGDYLVRLAGESYKRRSQNRPVNAA